MFNITYKKLHYVGHSMGKKGETQKHSKKFKIKIKINRGTWKSMSIQKKDGKKGQLVKFQTRLYIFVTFLTIVGGNTPMYPGLYNHGSGTMIQSRIVVSTLDCTIYGQSSYLRKHISTTCENVIRYHGGLKIFFYFLLGIMFRKWKWS